MVGHVVRVGVGNRHKILVGNTEATWEDLETDEETLLKYILNL